jgi:DNA mismatch repair protein MutL
LLDRGSAPRATGTTVEVADLFYNTPARRKFLNTPNGELRAALRMIECYALAFPEVGMRLTVDGRERFDWPPAARGTNGGSGSILSGGVAPEAAARRERAGALWGARHAEQLIEVSSEREGVRLDALLGMPEHARATREGQVFLVNRRWIQSPLLSHALRQAYGNLIPDGRFPAATLWLTVPPERLDVNVHPTKREVRFADEGTLFSLVAGAAAKALAHLHPPFTVLPGGRAAEPRWADRVREKPSGQTWLGLEVVPAGAERVEPASPTIDSAATSTTAPEPATAEPELWQLHRTYILAPVRNGLIIVDQHAAHERILYEQARARLEGERGASQQLLFPAVVDLSRSQFELLLELGPWLEQLGWDLSPFGPPTVVIQGVPTDLAREDPGRFLQDLLDGVTESTGRNAADDVSEHLARSHACHAAVRAGDALDQAEMRALVDRLFATSRPHGDPHGRPTFVRLDLEELHRRFGRG